MLSKQLQDQIIEEGKKRMEGWHDKMKAQVAKEEYEVGAVKYAALYETALARAERAEKALKQICGHNGELIPAKLDMIAIASNALTPKTGEDEY